MERPGAYQLQAAIAGAHSTAATAEETDWDAIAQLYEKLSCTTRSPVVELNRAVAVAMAAGPAAGLRIIDDLGDGGELEGYHLFHAARADLLRRLGRPEEAIAPYERALELAASEVERSFLKGRLAEVRSG
jgi:RNA polymerase sigma-70 factor (ECF subfamily)